MSSADPFSQRFIVPFQSQLDKHGYYEDDLHMIIVCNYTDNPFFPQVLEDDRKYDYLNLDRAEYDWIWLGKYNDSVANSIIKPEWFDAAIDAHAELGFKAKGATIIAHDPSDIGDDDKGLAVRKGSVILDVQCKEDGDVNEGCDWATSIAIDLKADMFVWDCDGLGVSLNRQVSEAFDGIKCDITQFKGSWSPANKDSVYDRSDSIREPKTNGETFKNRRSQYYWMLRDRFYKTYQAVEKGAYIDPDELISLSSSIKDMQALRSEVCRIPLKQNGNGVIQLMTKLEMSKEGIASPNMADSLMMCMEVPKIKKKWAKLNYQPTGIV
jgi:phage terminase large subunit